MQKKIYLCEININHELNKVIAENLKKINL
jgi:hypothetical protein